MMEHDHLDEGRCATCWTWDPLAATRTDDDPPLDVMTTGQLFFDLIFAGLPRLPLPGEELYSTGMGSCPGGIANMATAAARLGLRTGLAAGFGDDAYADWMWSVLSRDENIDLSASRRFDNFHSAITVSMAFSGDRAMVTHAHDLPEPMDDALISAPASRAATIDLKRVVPSWRTLRDRGTLLFADLGFDETGKWDTADLAPLQYCHAFTPNAVEAMAYTRTSRPTDAVRKLAGMVPLAVRQFGGSLAAPGWGDIADWWRDVSGRSEAGDLQAAYIARDYGFLGDLIPRHAVHGVRRAEGTFAVASHLD